MTDEQDRQQSTAHQQVGGQSPSLSRAPVPVIAAVSAVIPSMGAVYNQEYIKAVIHFAVFSGLVIVGDSVRQFQMAAMAFYLFTIIDAYRSAEAIGRRPPRPPEADTTEEINLPLWGGALILMGLIFLLDSLDVIRVKAIVKLWPLVFIGLGSYLIFDYVRGQKRSTKQSSASQDALSAPSTREKNHHGQETG